MRKYECQLTGYQTAVWMWVKSDTESVPIEQTEECKPVCLTSLKLNDVAEPGNVMSKMEGKQALLFSLESLSDFS